MASRVAYEQALALPTPRCWVVVAESGELGDGFVARCAWGQPLLLYRTGAGECVVMVDRCCHRQYPLSLGTRSGDDVVCGYHGFRFAPSGTCVSVPSQNTVPDRAGVRALPTIERGGWVWAWLSDSPPVAADLPEALAGDTWRSVSGSASIEAPAVLMVENLHDLSHIPFVHGSTIGSAAFAERPYKTWADGHVIKTLRTWSSVDCPPMYQRFAGLSGLVDRVIGSEFHQPSLVIIDSQIHPAGRPDSGTRRLVHEIAIVPTSTESLDYVWKSSWNFSIDDDSIADVIAQSERQVVDEDARVLKAQWASIRIAPSSAIEVSVRADSASLRARRAFAQFLVTGELSRVISHPDDGDNRNVATVQAHA